MKPRLTVDLGFKLRSHAQFKSCSILTSVAQFFLKITIHNLSKILRTLDLKFQGKTPPTEHRRCLIEDCIIPSRELPAT